MRVKYSRDNYVGKRARSSRNGVLELRLVYCKLIIINFAERDIYFRLISRRLLTFQKKEKKIEERKKRALFKISKAQGTFSLVDLKDTPPKKKKKKNARGSVEAEFRTLPYRLLRRRRCRRHRRRRLGRCRCRRRRRQRRTVRERERNRFYQCPGETSATSRAEKQKQLLKSFLVAEKTAEEAAHCTRLYESLRVGSDSYKARRLMRFSVGSRCGMPRREQRALRRNNITRVTAARSAILSE
ncbi:hypothetical protein PUN28_017654 [Cardiocondyla obscurior]|uniref:Uncharacterized protein n=1 Tax=Cardiocondyla obscurior TaxID=286306 RepID=A0AAW2EKM6_9HYME